MTNQQQKPTKEQLKIIALKQRIGEITSDYEDKMADFRAEFTQQMEAFNEVINNQEKDIEKLQNQLRTYQDNEPVQEEADSESSQD